MGGGTCIHLHFELHAALRQRQADMKGTRSAAHVGKPSWRLWACEADARQPKNECSDCGV